MGIFSRMTDIINSNINALLDTAEDPKKMIRMIIQEMEDTLVEVRSSSARVLAERKTAVRRVKRLHDEMQEWENKAKLALSKQREDLAKAALLEKQLIADEVEAVERELSGLDDNIEQLHEEIGQLQQKLSDAKAKQQTLQLRGKTVESRMKVKRQMQREVLDEAFSKFERFERRIDNLEGQIEALDLGNKPENDLSSEINALMEDEKIGEELARLKAQMNANENAQ